MAKQHVAYGTMLDFAQATALFMALMTDLGWILRWPVLALPSLAVALVAQAASVIYVQKTQASCVQELALLIWLVGSCFWLTAELLWDEKTSAGVLRHLELESASRYLGPVLGIGSLINWVGLGILGTVVRFNIGLNSESYILLWFVMEACWVTFNAVNAHPGNPAPIVAPWSTSLFYIGMIAGCAAVGILVHGVYTKRMNSRMLPWEFADFFFVAGNAFWFLNDFLFGDEVPNIKFVPTCMFPLGAAALLFGELFCKGSTDEQKPLTCDADC